MHVNVRVGRREDSAVLARIEADDLDRLAENRQTHLGPFVKLGTVPKAILLKDDRVPAAC